MASPSTDPIKETFVIQSLKSLYQIPIRSAKQVSEVVQTVVARVRRLPSDLGNVGDEICHVSIDCLDRINVSIFVLKNIIRRDLSANESICCGRAAKVGHFLVAETYFWTALCLIGFECGETVGCWPMLSRGFGMMLNRANSFVLAVVVLPFFFFTWLRKALVSDDTRRMWTLAVAFLIGLLMSYGYGQLSKIHTYPLYIMPFTMGGLGCYNAFYQRFALTRTPFLILCVVVSFSVYLLMALFCRDLSLVFLVWMTIMCSTALIDLQTKMGRLSRRWSTESLEQWMSTLSFIAAQMLFRVLLMLIGHK